MVKRERAQGAASAAPIPCTARAARRAQPLTARPPTQGAEGEDRDADQEHPAAPEEISRPRPEEEEPAEGEDVGVDHPGKRAGREPEALLNVREGDVHDRRVQHHHQLSGEDHRQQDRSATEPVSRTLGQGKRESETCRGRDRGARGQGRIGALTTTFPLVIC